MKNGCEAVFLACGHGIIIFAVVTALLTSGMWLYGIQVCTGISEEQRVF